MPIRAWPTAERPREKLLARGVAALSNAELLALLLGSGDHGRSALELGRDLLTPRGGLRALLELEPTAMAAERGLGPAAIARLHAALELGRRHLAEELDRPDALADPATCATYLRSRLRSHVYEVFAVLFLDNRHRPIAFEEMFRGSIHGASVYPREVVRRCLQHNAAAVIFAHNHPSGVVEPSQADREITAQLKHALNYIDVRVLDHFIVGGGIATMSFAERGLL